MCSGAAASDSLWCIFSAVHWWINVAEYRVSNNIVMCILVHNILCTPMLTLEKNKKNNI